MPMFIDISGNTYGRLTAVKRAPNVGKRTFWEFLCACGNTHIADASTVKLGGTQSCGCLYRESIATNGRAKATHGHNRNGKATKTHNAWSQMKGRCTNPKNIAYKNYGGRGITFCDRWTLFENFLEDMGNPPSKAYSLDRINNERGYSKENCRWATVNEQERNKRNIKLTIEKAALIRSDTRKQAVIAADYGVSRATVGRVKQGKIWA